MRLWAGLLACLLAGPAAAQHRTTPAVDATLLIDLGIRTSGVHFDDDYVTTFGLTPGVAWAVSPAITFGISGNAGNVVGRRFSGHAFGLGPQVTYYFPRTLAAADTIRQGARIRVIPPTQPVFYYVRGGFELDRLRIDLELLEPVVRATTDIGRTFLVAGAFHRIAPRTGLFAEVMVSYDHRFRIEHRPPYAGTISGTGAVDRGGVGISVVIGFRLIR